MHMFLIYIYNFGSFQFSVNTDLIPPWEPSNVTGYPEVHNTPRQGQNFLCPLEFSSSSFLYYTHTHTYTCQTLCPYVLSSHLPKGLRGEDYQHPSIPDKNGLQRLSNRLKFTQLINNVPESGFSDSMFLIVCFGVSTG